MKEATATTTPMPHPSYVGQTIAEVEAAKRQFIEALIQTKEYRDAVRRIACMPHVHQSFILFAAQASGGPFFGGGRISARDLICGEMNWSSLKNEVGLSLGALPTNWASIIRQVDGGHTILRLEWKPVER